MAAHLQTLLEAIVADPQERISRLALLPAGTQASAHRLERHRGQISPPQALFSIDLPSRQSGRRTPPAVSASRVRLSYRELARRSSVIADRLAENGVGRDVIVILLAERGVDLLAGMIAVQRAGGSVSAPGPSASRRQTRPNHSHSARG